MIFALLIFLAWGSHLNSLAYRLLNLESFFKARSFCTSCKKNIAWYDNLPIISWLFLYGQCRQCKQPISWLYPFIEIMTTATLMLLYQFAPVHYFPAYFLFFSALIITIRTDLDEMLISRFVTLYLIPFGYLAAFYLYLPISLSTAILGSLFGYVLLWCAKIMSLKISGQEGMGQGDLELLTMIGAFTGPLGCWVTLTIGSCLGALIHIGIMAITKQRTTKVAFGPYLSIGAMIYVFYQDQFISYFLL